MQTDQGCTFLASVTADSYDLLMSLTGEISERGLPLREFFESRLPNCKEMQASWRAQGDPKIVPSKTVAWGLVGAAFDYRIRYFFSITPPDRFVAALGAGHEFRHAYKNLASSLTNLIALNQPCGTLLPLKSEEELLRYCYLLAMYESLFRRSGVNSPLNSLRSDATSSEQLALVPPADLADLMALSSGAASALKDHFKSPIIANPTFLGSGDVGGADADLIIDNTLIDIKSTKNKSLEKIAAYQLVGYVLLDYEDEYEISHLGFYMSRIPALVVWPAEHSVEVMSNGEETIESLRSELRHFLGEW
jgi:hypothetical protein